MMNKDLASYKVALVTEFLWGMGGANKVLECFSEIFPEADIYSLFGNKKFLSKQLQKHNIAFSFLNKLPLIKHFYRYTFHLWPTAIEQFDLTNYDIVISNSASVAHGAITSLECKHVAYINSPMRYVWDLNHLYSDIVRFGFFKRVIKEILVSFNRVWDVVAAQRPEIIITNSEFVKKRVTKYWDREVTVVLSPPVKKYEGETVSKRKDYFVSGAPFEPNKRGDFLLECASKLGFQLKLIGEGSLKKKLQRRYGKFKNIQFLGWVKEEEKWKLISNAKGYIVPGIEDYGIFCAEAISCGTPVLAYKKGGSLEIINDGVNGLFFDNWNIKEFEKSFNKLKLKKWDYKKVRYSLKNTNSKEDFEREIIKMLVE